MASNTTEPLSTLRLRSDKVNAESNCLIHLELNPDFQREYEAWSDEMVTRFIESMLLGRKTNPIWVIVNNENNCEDILDGKHRLTTAIRFTTDFKALDKSSENIKLNGKFLDPQFKDLYNKTFSELPQDAKSKILNYNFDINRLDSSYNNPDKKHEMWLILNRSSRPLNKFEMMKPLYKDFYSIIEAKSLELTKTVIYPEKESKRGSSEMEILRLIALSYSKSKKFNSLQDNYDKWVKSYIGDNSEDIKKSMREKSDEIKDVADKIVKFNQEFINISLHQEFDNDVSKIKPDDMAYKIILARCVGRIKNVSTLMNKPKIEQFIKDCREKIFKNIDPKGQRNASFQKWLIDEADSIILEIYSDLGVRYFTEKQIKRKLAEQENKCPKCKKLITKGQEYEGDHIKSHYEGGSTIYENLQVLHKNCHIDKTTK